VVLQQLLSSTSHGHTSRLAMFFNYGIVNRVVGVFSTRFTSIAPAVLLLGKPEGMP